MKYSDFEKQLGDKLRSHEVDLDTTAFYTDLMKRKGRKKPFAVIYRLPFVLLGLVLSVFLIYGISGQKGVSENQSANHSSSTNPVSYEAKLISSENSNKDFESFIKHNDISIEQSSSVANDVSTITLNKDNRLADRQNTLSKNLSQNIKNKAFKNNKLLISNSKHSSTLNNTIISTKKKLAPFNERTNKSFSSAIDNSGKEVYELNERNIVSFEKLDLLFCDNININPTIPQLKEVECPDFKINKVQMTIEILADAGYFYPVKSFIDQSNEINEVNTLRNSYETSKEGWHAGIYAKFRNSKWPIYIQAGVSQNFLTERMNLKYEFTKIDTTQGIISITTSENGDTITAIIGDIITQTEVSGKKIKHYNLQTIDIPVTVGYSLDLNRFTVDVEGGVLFNLSMKSSGSILTSQSDFDDISSQDPFKSKLGISYLGGISLGYHITPRSKIYINSKMRIIPEDINTHNNTLSQRYKFLGLNLGYGYIF